MKELSIIIVNYNSNDFLNNCLESLGDIPEDWEIIVIDNASITKIKIKNKKSNVTLIENKSNKGFSAANNQGIRKTNSNYVLLLNPDTIVSQHALKRMISFMNQTPKAGIATCKVLLPSDKIDDASHRGFPTPWNAFCYFSGLAKLAPYSTTFNGYHMGYQYMDTIHEIDACVGAFMLIRSSAGNQVQWLDEDYFWYGEDLDICFKVKQKDWKIYYVPDVSISHFKGASSGIKKHRNTISSASKETRMMAQKARFDAMELFYEKHYNYTYSPLVFSIVRWGIKSIRYFYIH